MSSRRIQTAEVTATVERTFRATGQSRPARVGTGLPSALVLLLAVAGCSFTAAAPLPSAGPAGQSGELVVILASATAHEPRPALSPQALQTLQSAARSRNVSDGANGRSSVALITTAQGGSSTQLPLTPRRANGAVEHGAQRDQLIDENVQHVSTAVTQAMATEPRLDLLEGIGNATRGPSPGSLILITNGLSTTGGLDLREVGWNDDPLRVAHQLKDRALLPDLTGWKVLFSGLGETAGQQPELPLPLRAKIIAYWRALCNVAGAASCEVDDSPLPATTPTATADLPIVDIPLVTSVTGPTGETTTTLPDAQLGFDPESAVLAAAFLPTIQDIAADINSRLASRPDATVTVTGYTADPIGSTQDGRRQLSAARARAVADALAAAGLTHPILPVGGGAAPETTAVRNGLFIESVAMTMRRCEITY